MAAKKTTFLQDTEAVPILKSSGIPIKEGRSSGSQRFMVEKHRQRKSLRGKREKQTTEGHGDGGEGRAKPHQTAKKDIQSLKTVL